MAEGNFPWVTTALVAGGALIAGAGAATAVASRKQGKGVYSGRPGKMYAYGGDAPMRGATGGKVDKDTWVSVQQRERRARGYKEWTKPQLNNMWEFGNKNWGRTTAVRKKGKKAKPKSKKRKAPDGRRGKLTVAQLKRQVKAAGGKVTTRVKKGHYKAKNRTGLMRELSRLKGKRRR